MSAFPHPSPETLEAIRQFDTCTVANAIEGTGAGAESGGNEVTILADCEDGGRVLPDEPAGMRTPLVLEVRSPRPLPSGDDLGLLVAGSLAEEMGGKIATGASTEGFWRRLVLPLPCAAAADVPEPEMAAETVFVRK